MVSVVFLAFRNSHLALNILNTAVINVAAISEQTWYDQREQEPEILSCFFKHAYSSF